MNSLPTNQPTPSVVPFSSRMRKVFLAPNGIRAGWRFLIFIFLIVLWQVAIRQGLAHLPVLARIAREARGSTITPGAASIFSKA